MSTHPIALNVRELTSETWPDFETLFRSRGGPRYCWCMVWRGTPAETKIATSASRRDAMRSRVERATHVGLLAYRDEHPVAWCSVGPRDTFQMRMAGRLDGDTEERVWSLTCFFVTREFRHQGAIYVLIDAAKAHARAHGATVLEAYPVAPDSPSYRFGGFLSAFERAGFAEVGMAGSRRHVVRYRLTEAA